MNVGIHLETNILSCLFCWLLYDQQRRHKVFDFLGSTAFNSLLAACIFIMVLDSTTWLMMANIIPHTDQHLLFVQSIYYFVQALIPMYFMMYCYNTSGHKVHPFVEFVAYIAAFFTLLVLISNYTYGFAFYVENNNIYRNHGFITAILAPMLYITTSMVLCTIFMLRNRKGSDEKRNISFHMFVCIGISFVGAIVCSFVEFVSPWHIFIAALIYLYMRLHGYREHHLDVLAYTDSLTGLKNHAMYSVLKENMDKRIRTNDNLHFAVAVMDVNYLKQVNDVCGHRAGDDLLKSASRIICHTFDHSPVCRIGGDEFVAILEGSDYENREALRAQFEESMQSATFFSENRELPLSIALGICQFSPKKHYSFEEVFHEADEAMYQNKAAIKAARTFRINA